MLLAGTADEAHRTNEHVYRVQQATHMARLCNEQRARRHQWCIATALESGDAICPEDACCVTASGWVSLDDTTRETMETAGGGTKRYEYGNPALCSRTVRRP